MPLDPRSSRGCGFNFQREARRRLRQPTLANWVEFEDGSARGRFQRMVEVDPIDDPNEPDTERDASRDGTKRVAKERDSLRRIQLGRPYLFLPASNGDRRAASSAQVAHPMDLAPGRPDPTPAGDVDDRHRRRPRQAALPAPNGEEPVEAQGNAGGQQKPGEWGEESDPPWCLGGAVTSSGHVRGSFLHRFVRGARQVTRKKARPWPPPAENAPQP